MDNIESCAKKTRTNQHKQCEAETCSGAQEVHLSGWRFLFPIHRNFSRTFLGDIPTPIHCDERISRRLKHLLRLLLHTRSLWFGINLPTAEDLEYLSFAFTAFVFLRYPSASSVDFCVLERGGLFSAGMFVEEKRRLSQIISTLSSPACRFLKSSSRPELLAVGTRQIRQGTCISHHMLRWLRVSSNAYLYGVTALFLVLRSHALFLELLHRICP